MSHKCSWETVPTVPIKEVNFWNDSFHVESTSNILVIQLTNVVVVLMQSVNKLPPCEKHSKNCYLSSPIMKPKQNSEGISSTCVRKVLLHGSKTWPVVTEGVQQSVCADSGMIRWICGVSLKDRIQWTDFLFCLGLSSIKVMLRFHGHLIQMDDNAWPKKATKAIFGLSFCSLKTDNPRGVFWLSQTSTMELFAKMIND